jgi:hypothetical protein
MSSRSVFERIFSAHTLELAAINTLAAWFPTYLREVELQNDLVENQIKSPRTYTTRNEFTTFPEDQMPICVVVSPGLAEPPTAEGNGKMGGWYSLGVGVLASASTEEATNFLSKLYASAIRAIMLQKSDLGGVCSGIEWLDESFDDIPDDSQTRTIRAAQWIGIAYIDDVVTRGAGPIGPPNPEDQPGSVWVRATSGSITLVKKED